MSARASAVLVALVCVLAACGGNGDEDRLRLVAYPGYVEDGSNDPRIDWVTPFERATGCEVGVRVVRSSTELLEVVTHGRYDGVSASADIAQVLVGGGEVEGEPVPIVRYDDVLLWRTDLVRGAPTVAQLWDTTYAGSVAIYDSAMQLAQAALHLGVRDPYALDLPLFNRVVRVAARQRSLAGAFWVDDVQLEAHFTGGNVSVGIVPLRVAERLRADGVPVRWTALPAPRLARVDSWLRLTGAENPRCLAEWLGWQERIRGRVARNVGGAVGPVPDGTLVWRTPVDACGDDRLAACADWFEWHRAWGLIRSD